MSYIFTSKNVRILVDSDDYPLLNRHKWYISSTGYAMTTISGKNIRMHHMVLGKPALGYVCDHVNRQKLDNRKSNLRHVTLTENARNSERKSSKYQYRGVRPNKNNWMAYLTNRGKQVYLGTFKDIKDAARAYNKGAEQHFGEFAVLNEVEK